MKRHNYLRGKVLKTAFKKPLQHFFFFANVITRCYYDMKRHNEAFEKQSKKKTLYNILPATLQLDAAML